LNRRKKGGGRFIQLGVARPMDDVEDVKEGLEQIAKIITSDFVKDSQ